MADRTLPNPDRYASCPRDGKVLQYYHGIFDSVYVSLSPFIRPLNASLSPFDCDTYPDRCTVNKTCTPIGWQSVLAELNLSSLSELDIALRTQIGGLNPEHANESHADELERALKSTQTISPAEGCHSELLHDSVLGLFKGLGHDWVWVGDEFCSERKLHWIDDLLSEKSETIAGTCNVFTPDKTLLWTVHWDSHFSFFAGSKNSLKRVNIEDKLEGFFCGDETQLYWSLQQK